MNHKIILVSKDSNLFSEGSYIIAVNAENSSLKKTRIIGWKYALFSKFKFVRRLLRAEITGLYKLSDGSNILVAKKGLFRKCMNDDSYKQCFSIPRGSKPLNICVAPSGSLFWGEYFQNIEKQSVNIYKSEDNGVSWFIVHTFEEGNINHIHGLFYDRYTNRIWVATGDRENECIIGYSEDEFKSFHEVFRGGQEYRLCQMFFYSDFVVFATDSQYIQNEIRLFDRKSLEIKTLAKIQGSAIKGGQSEYVSFLSTTVEPSEVNREKNAHIWVTKDGINWKDVYSAPKDRWPSIFQYGTFEFPRYDSPIKDKLYFSGRALKGHDGKSSFISLSTI